jgi:hypothetical protein
VVFENPNPPRMRFDLGEDDGDGPWWAATTPLLAGELGVDPDPPEYDPELMADWQAIANHRQAQAEEEFAAMDASWGPHAPWND